MDREGKVYQMMATMTKLRVKDLDFQTNQITFLHDGKITFLNLASEKMDVFKDLCMGKSSEELIFPESNTTSPKWDRSRKPHFVGSSSYGDDLISTIKDVLLNYF